MRRKLLNFFFSFLILLSSFSFAFPSPVRADREFAPCQLLNLPSSLTDQDNVFPAGITIDTNGQAVGGSDPNRQRYDIWLFKPGGGTGIRLHNDDGSIVRFQANNDGKIVINRDFDREGKIGGSHDGKLPEGTFYIGVTEENSSSPRCQDLPDSRMAITVTHTETGGGENCTISFPGAALVPGEELNMKVNFTSATFRGGDNQKFDVIISWQGNERKFVNADQPTATQLEQGFSIGSYGGGIVYKAEVRRGFGSFGDEKSCSQNFTIDSSGGHVGCNRDNECPNGQICVADDKGIKKCQEPGGKHKVPAVCKTGADENSYVCKTAVGEVGADPEGFAQKVLGLLLSLAGAILLIFIIINGYKFMFSQGDPEKIKEAREGIIAAVAGLLLIIFSLALLQFVTVTVLDIPGFR